VSGLIRLALESPASLAILPLQDLLGLDGAARMNTPGTFEGNWQWSFEWNALDELKKKHREPHNPFFNGYS
jgi:4-alpha-glucanotransferase